MINKIFTAGFLWITLCCVPMVVCAQQVVVGGKVIDAQQLPIKNASVFVLPNGPGTSTDEEGAFKLRLTLQTGDVEILFSHVRYRDQKIALKSMALDTALVVIMKDSVRLLHEIDVTGAKKDKLLPHASTYTINPLKAKFTPSPFHQISSLLVTLPGVSASNELSSGYNVRGGNYDENLVYVNNIPVYRPQIITAGQQEGLSFVNLDLVRSIEFSSGGWEAKYGDGLASNLNIQYKKPSEFHGSIDAGLLGGSAHVEGISKNGKFSYLAGGRIKSSTYLLNTLETKGEYRPRFADVQTYLNFDLSPKGKKNTTTLGILAGYARNKYLVEPSSRETTFGTFNEQKRLYVAFEGREKLNYDTWQTGILLNHRLSPNWKTHLLVSGIFSREREYYDIEGGYLLCNVDNNPSSSSFNKCLTNIGIGTQYKYGRNRLDATLFQVESRNEVIINQRNTTEFGFGYGQNTFDDHLHEYEFIDSADFVTVNRQVQADNKLNYAKVHAYWQNATELNTHHSLTYGLRGLFQTYINQLMISPRIQYAWNPIRMPNTYFRFSTGFYRQAPFYREFRNREGVLNKHLKPQSSVHTIAGMDVRFTKWGRPFKFTSEVYYKYLWNVNPYDIENVRIRYYAQNIALAYATGVDFRLSGEFIPGEESWFSLGLMSTKEDLGDGRGYVPRPTDQRLNAAIFFQDYLPDMPSFKVHLRVLYATGLPFSPPDNPEYRNAFRGSNYQRLDIGFSKKITLKPMVSKSASHLWLRAEILNLTGHQNAISYSWIEDINQRTYAIPNNLSQRFFNIQLRYEF